MSDIKHFRMAGMQAEELEKAKPLLIKSYESV